MLVVDSLAYAFILLSSFIGSFGAMLVKKVNTKQFWKLRWVLDGNFVFGVLLYGSSAIIYLLALRRGQVSFLYPLLAVSYIWVLIWSKIFLKEKISKKKILGVVLITIGILIMHG